MVTSIEIQKRWNPKVYSKPTDSHPYLQADSCHHLPSVLGIQKGVALRLHRICSTDEKFNSKAKEYKAYLIGRGYKLKNVEKSFNDALNMSWQQSHIKKTKSTNSKNKIAFCSKHYSKACSYSWQLSNNAK